MENQPAKSTDANWDDTVPKDTWRNYAATGRLAVVLAGVTFGCFFFPFADTNWGLPIATLAAYSVLVFAMAFRDRNCALRNPQVRELLPQFLLMHVPFSPGRLRDRIGMDQSTVHHAKLADGARTQRVAI